jgi:hypothetical protein
MSPLENDGPGRLDLSTVSQRLSPLQEWEQNRDEPSFQRSAGLGETLSTVTVGCEVESNPSASTRSSMASNNTSRGSLSSSNVPELVSRTSMDRKDSGSSMESMNDSHQTLSLQYALDIEEGDVAVVPEPDVEYECPFHVFCKDRAHLPKWMSTAMHHFHHHPPPLDSICPFCDCRFQGTDGKACWMARMDHVGVHYRETSGITLENSRPDYHLYRYLLGLHLVRMDIFDQFFLTNTREPVPGEGIWGIVDAESVGSAVHFEESAVREPISVQRRDYRAQRGASRR